MHLPMGRRLQGSQVTPAQPSITSGSCSIIKCAFSQFTLDHGRDLIWFQRNTQILQWRNFFTYMIGVLFGITIRVIFKLHLMCFKCSGPYKRSGYESFTSKSRGNWKQLGNQCCGAVWSDGGGNPAWGGTGLVRACSFVVAGASTGLLNPCPVFGDPRLPRCSFSLTGETSSGERTKKSLSFFAHLFFLSVVLFYLYI